MKFDSPLRCIIIPQSVITKKIWQLEDARFTFACSNFRKPHITNTPLRNFRSMMTMEQYDTAISFNHFYKTVICNRHDTKVLTICICVFSFTRQATFRRNARKFMMRSKGYSRIGLFDGKLVI